MLCVSLLLFASVHAQPPRGNGIGGIFLDPVDPGDFRFRLRLRERCINDYRTIDGSCTNSEQRKKLWGSAGRPHFSYFFFSSSATPAGQGLPSPRYISNIISKQHIDVPNSKGLTEFFVFFGQFLDHNIVATPVDRSKPMPIPIPSDDPIFFNFSGGVLPFHRSEVGQVLAGHSAVRPVNSVTSPIDLSAVYGSDEMRAGKLRSFQGGKLLTSNGDFLPRNTVGLFNAPSSEDKYFVAGDHRANEHPALTSLHTLFVREHNRLCDELKAVFPGVNDEDLYQMARKINGAQYQKIVYEQFIPALSGRSFDRYRGFNSRVDPTVSDIFSTAAFRVGHTLVGNFVNRRGPFMSPMSPLSMREMFFRSYEVMGGGIEPFLRGAIDSRAQQIDTLVVDALRNFLFSDVPEEGGFDLVALNLQRGRDHALPSYNDIRRIFRLRPRRSFREITRNINLQLALFHLYGTPDRVEAWVGMMAEDHVPGAAAGETLLVVWAAEFARLRDGDRFFYLESRQFPPFVWSFFPRLREMMSEKDTMRSIILRNTQIRGEELPPNLFRK